MISRKSDIAERTIAFSLRIIRLFQELDKDSVGRVIGNQLLRSATSIGANVHEAKGAQSNADFIAKMSIAHKEAYETVYWLRLVTEAKLLDPSKLSALSDEAAQLVRILSASLITLKNKK